MSTIDESPGSGPVEARDPDRRATTQPCLVGVGVPAGSRAALRALLTALPEGVDAAFVVVQQAESKTASLSADDLHGATALPVQVADDGVELVGGRIWLVPPGRYARARGGVLRLEAPHEPPRMPIDVLLRSLAESAAQRAAGVLLGNTGRDGLAGLRDVKAAGGLAIVEESTNRGDDDPGIDAALEVGAMPALLQRFADGALTPDRVPAGELSPPITLAVLDLLHTHTDVDFGGYKRSTLARRLRRRMALRQIEDPARYLEVLRGDHRELRRLFKDLLIHVTAFFREEDGWQALRRTVLEPLAEGERAPRVWVAGCATGEEAYTVAILLREACQRQGREWRGQIYATDADPDAIAVARKGIYPRSIVADVGSERVQRWFVECEQGYRVVPELRDSLVFAVQNLVEDPPFSNLDLVSCRNVLIYLEPDTQQRVLELFHFALRADGHLLLGGSESVGTRTTLFTPTPGRATLFRRAGLGVPPPVRLPRACRRGGSVALPNATENARSILLQRFAPAAVLVDRRQRVVYFHGPVKRYLDFPTGEPTTDVVRMAIDGLRARLRTLLPRALREGRAVAERCSLHRDGEDVAVRVEVEPVEAPGADEPFLLVSFVDEPVRRMAAAGEESDAAALGRVAALEDELQRTREDLQSTIEELESSNEELQASNEEVLSMNEELHSTNEELETSRVELQALNDELSSVNGELEQKVVELQATNDDLGNLLASTDVATLFLDTQLALRRCTPAADRLGVLAEDVGRPVAELLPRFDDGDLVADAAEVMRTRRPIEREVRTGEQAFMRRVLPYRAAGDRVAGVVVTFTDVTSLVDATTRLARRERQQAVLAELGQIAAGTVAPEALFERALTFATDTLAARFATLVRRRTGSSELAVMASRGFEGEVPAAIPAGPHSQAGYALTALAPIVAGDLTRERRFSPEPVLREHAAASGISVIVGRGDEPWGALSVHTDVPASFTVDDVNFLQALAHVLAGAIERDRANALLRRKVHQLTVLHQIAVLAAESESTSVILQRCITTLCEVQGWPIGHAYLPSADGSRMLSSDLWHCSVEDTLARLQRASSQTSFAPGESVIGEVWFSGKPKCIANVRTSASFARTRNDPDLPVTGMLAFPVIRDGVVVAVLEFFSQRTMTVEDDLLLMLEIVGAQIGRVVERSRSREALRRSQQHLARAMRAGRMGTWEWDLITGTTTWSDLHYELLGYRHGAMTPSYDRWLERIHPDDRSRAIEIVEDAKANKVQYVKAYRIVRPDGSERWIESRGQFDYDGDRPIRMAGVILDVTERVEAEQALREQERRKDEFLAVLGHELRNPLAALSNGIRVLEAGNRPLEEREWVRRMMAKQIGQVTGIVDDLLDLSRITRGLIRLHLATVRVADVVAQALDSVGSTIEERMHDVTVEVPAHLTVLADPLRLEQIVCNLLANAARYTPTQGSISVRATEDADRIRIEVCDNGIGLEPAQRRTIFEPFAQVQKGSGGLGIGLALVRQLIEQHGGEIEARSEGRGKGSTFVAWLPAAQGPDAVEPSTAAPTPDLAGTRVLVVDDNVDAADTLEILLTSAGCTVEVAHTGMAALQRAARLRPHVVLLDVGLPDTNGFEVAAALRQEPLAKGALLVAVTGFGDEDTRKRIESSAFDLRLVKPVAHDELLDLLHRTRGE